MLDVERWELDLFSRRTSPMQRQQSQKLQSPGASPGCGTICSRSLTTESLASNQGDAGEIPVGSTTLV